MRDATRFFFQRANREIGARRAIAKIIAHPIFQSACALALRDVDEIMQNQFAIVPRVHPNQKSVTETHATRVFGDDANASCRFRERWVLWKGDSIDNENSDAVAIFHSGQSRIGCVTWSQRISVPERELLEILRPLVSEW